MKLKAKLWRGAADLNKWLISLALMSGSVGGCRANDALSTPSGVVPITSLPRPLTPEEQQLVTANNAFAFKLFNAVSESAGPDANVFISPLSVAMTLGMAYNGSGGATQAQMQQVLGIEGMDVSQVNESYQSLIALLTHLDPNVTASIGNSIWYAQSFTPYSSFLNATGTYYSATVQSLDLSSAGAPALINQWVENATQGKILTIAPDPIPASAVMLLVNAIYFRGSWSKRFDPTRTQPSSFTMRTGDTTIVPMMSDAGGVPGWWWGDLTTVDIADVPYGGDAFRMTIILPRKANAIDSVAPTLTNDTWNTWLSRLEATTIDLHLPRFTFAFGSPLNDVLGALGMPAAFCGSSGVDFSSMGPGSLCISDVMHKSFVDVNEDGTEAAGATSGTMELSYADFPPVVVNHPFLFVIRERFSGAILFLGKVMNPETAAM